VLVCVCVCVCLSLSLSLTRTIFQTMIAVITFPILHIQGANIEYIYLLHRVKQLLLYMEAAGLTSLTKHKLFSQTRTYRTIERYCSRTIMLVCLCLLLLFCVVHCYYHTYIMLMYLLCGGVYVGGWWRMLLWS
jgi:hypothetical protein